jgi:hypothetical protein
MRRLEAPAQPQRRRLRLTYSGHAVCSRLACEHRPLPLTNRALRTLGPLRFALLEQRPGRFLPVPLGHRPHLLDRRGHREGPYDAPRRRGTCRTAIQPVVPLSPLHTRCVAGAGEPRWTAPEPDDCPTPPAAGAPVSGMVRAGGPSSTRRNTLGGDRHEKPAGTGHLVVTGVRLGAGLGAVLASIFSIVADAATVPHLVDGVAVGAAVGAVAAALRLASTSRRPIAPADRPTIVGRAAGLRPALARESRRSQPSCSAMRGTSVDAIVQTCAGSTRW